MISITVFDNLYDNKTDKRVSVEGVEEFITLLKGMREVAYKDKSSAPLISPATFTEGSTRANGNVVEWAGWAALDIDDYDCIDPENIESELKSNWGGYKYVCYSTASSTIKKPKFRLVFPLTNEVPHDKIKHFWFALNNELNDVGDTQTKDLSRMYYVPGTYDGAYNFLFVNDSDVLNPYELMVKHEYVEKPKTFIDSLPKAMREQVLAHRKSEMTNTSIYWTNYRDCPFVSKRMVQEYSMISETGWYAKMYAIMISIAGSAVKKKYPITAKEVAVLCSQIDSDFGCWYKNRPLELEAGGAIEYIYGNL